jgi:hypothetical protein
MFFVVSESFVSLIPLAFPKRISEGEVTIDLLQLYKPVKPPVFKTLHIFNASKEKFVHNFENS